MTSVLAAVCGGKGGGANTGGVLVPPLLPAVPGLGLPPLFGGDVLASPDSPEPPVLHPTRAEMVRRPARNNGSDTRL